MPIVNDHVGEDGNFVVGKAYILEWNCRESEAFSVVAKAFRLDNRITATDGNTNRNVKGVYDAGACDRAGDLVDGEIIAGTLETLLQEHVGWVTVPVYGTAFKFVYRPVAPVIRGFVSRRETEPAYWAAHREIAVANVTIYGMGLGWAGPVDVSSSEFTESSVAGGCFVSDWVAEVWLATNSHPFKVYISDHKVGTCFGVGIYSTDNEVIKASLAVGCRRIISEGKSEAASPFVVNRANDCMGSRSR